MIIRASNNSLAVIRVSASKNSSLELALAPNQLKIKGAAMTLTKPFRLPFPQKSSKNTSFATPTLTVNPTTGSLRTRTSSKQSIIIVLDAQTRIVWCAAPRLTTTNSVKIDPLNRVLNKLSLGLNKLSLGLNKLSLRLNKLSLGLNK